LISSRNCNTGKSKLMTRSLNGITTRLWVDLIIIIMIHSHNFANDNFANDCIMQYCATS
jgi:hypothetical protein